jgi:hypothetical protein
MKSYKLIAFLIACAAALAISSSPAQAQVVEAASVAAPMVVNAVNKATTKKNPGAVWLKAEVVHADARTIIVREKASELTIHTFTYAPNIQDHMQNLEDKGGFQSGDKIKIQYMPGQTVALKIHGKPSKSL